jgi:O-antigen/teichoic acid export membrane protein
LKDLLKRILNNPTLMTWASYFVNFGNLVLILPLIINKFTIEEQNVWFQFNFIMGLAFLADSGFSPSLVRAFSYFRAGALKIPRTKEEYQNTDGLSSHEPNYNKLRDLMTTSFRIYSIIGIVVIIFLLTAGVALSLNIMNQAGNRPDLWIAYGLFVLYCMVTVLTIRWSSAIRGLDYVAFEARINTLMGVIKVVAFGCLLVINQGILSLVIYLLLDSIFKYLYLRAFIFKWFRDKPGQFSSLYYFDKEIFNSIWKTTWNTGLTFVALYIIGYIDALIVGQFKNTVQINSFFITKRIFAFVKGFCRAPFYANIQRIYSLGAAKDFTSVKEKASVYIFYSMFLLIGSFAGLALLGNPILNLFTETRLVSFPIFLVMALTILLDFHSGFHADIYVSSNHFPFLIPATVTGGVIAVFSILIKDTYGIMGLILVPFIAQLLINNWYPVFLSFRLTNWNLKRYCLDLFRYGFEDMNLRIKHIFKQ